MCGKDGEAIVQAGEEVAALRRRVSGRRLACAAILAALGCTALAAPQSAAALSFRGESLSTPDRPIDVTVGDFDGDGHRDFATSAIEADLVSVRLGDGAGGFSARTDYPVGNRPFGVQALDVDGDGRDDLAVANGDDDTISILIAAPGGGFPARRDISSAGELPGPLASADFDRDGRPDLAVGNLLTPKPGQTAGFGSVVVLLNRPGGFVAQAARPFVFAPADIVTGDFDEDGDVDVFAVESNADRSSTLLNDGDGNLTAGAETRAGTRPEGGATGDFDKDGHLDIVQAGIFGKLPIRLGAGDGSFVWPPFYQPPNLDIDLSPADPEHIEAADVDEDGHVDLMVTLRRNVAAVGFLAGDGTGRFAAPTLSATGADPFELALTDFDEDGHLDFVTANRSNDSATVGLNTISPRSEIVDGPPAVTGDATPTFAFSADEPDAAFSCRIDDGAYSPCASPHTPVQELSEGEHIFRVRASDGDGNEEQTPSSRTFTIDLTAPQTAIDAGPDGQTNDTTPTFAFSAGEAGASFQCSVDGGDFAACGSPSTIDSPLQDGEHVFRVRATDPAGNTDPTAASRSFTVDTAAPQTTITSGPPDVVYLPRATFAFTASEPGSEFACRLDGDDPVACSSPHRVSGLSPGSHSVAVTATDPAGNSDASPASRSFVFRVCPGGLGQTLTDLRPLLGAVVDALGRLLCR